MSIATIKFEDADLNTGKFSVDVNIAGAKTDDGFATAAHVTAMFVAKAVNTPEFAEGAAAYGHVKGWAIRKDTPQTIILTLTDIDLDAGSYDLTVAEDEGAIIEGSVTAAYMSALFVKDAMGTVEFRMACSAFAHDLIAGRPDAKVNEPCVESAIPANNDTEQKAA